MYQYRQIENALTSLSDSTHCEIQLKNETFSFDGLNSDLISHQSCTVTHGHGVSNLVIFNNTNYVLIVAGYYVGDKGISPTLDCGLWRKLPSHLIRGLFKFPATVPEWLSGDNVIEVLVPNRMMRFDDEGTPVLHPRFEVKVDDCKIVYSEDYSEEIDSINNLRLFEGRIWDGDHEVINGFIVSHIPDRKFQDAVYKLGWFTPEVDSNGYRWVERKEEIPLPNP
jgi:hypothetical protein